MANQINKNLAAELKNFNKDELTETKTSENIVTPVTGKNITLFRYSKNISEVAREKVLVELGEFSKTELDHVETIEKNHLPSVDDLKQCKE